MEGQLVRCATALGILIIISAAADLASDPHPASLSAKEPAPEASDEEKVLPLRAKNEIQPPPYEFAKESVGESTEVVSKLQALSKNETEQLEEFLQWMFENGATLSSVAITEFQDGQPLYKVGTCKEDEPGCYRGVVALADLEPGQVIVSVPLNLTVLDNHPEDSELIPQPFEGAELDDRLAVHLLQEKVLGRQSKMWHYLNVLPERPTVPVLFSDKEAQELQYQKLLDLRTQMLEVLSHDFEALRNNSKVAIGNSTLDDYIWAHSIVASRTFTDYYEDEQGEQRQVNLMVPLADMLNHDPEYDATWKFNWAEKRFQLIVEEDMAEGEEVHLSYGGRALETWITQYGYAPLEEPGDAFALFDNVEEAVYWHVKEFGLGNETNRTKLEEASLDEYDFEEVIGIAQQSIEHYRNYTAREDLDDGDELGTKSGGTIDDRLVVVMGELWSNGTAFCFGCNEELGYCTMVTSAYVHAIEATARRSESLLAGFPTSIEEDEAFLQKKGVVLSDNVKAAVWYRMMRKKSLQELIKGLGELAKQEEGPDTVIWQAEGDGEGAEEESFGEGLDIEDYWGDEGWEGEDFDTGVVELDSGYCWYSFLMVEAKEDDASLT